MSRAQGDSIVAKLLQKADRVEVRSWLSAKSNEERCLGQCGSPEASLALAEEIYRAGAEEVWAVDIDHYTIQEIDGDRERASTGKLVVRLPSGQPARTRFFRWEGRHSRSLGFDPRSDEGQEYLFIPLD